MLERALLAIVAIGLLALAIEGARRLLALRDRRLVSRLNERARTGATSDVTSDLERDERPRIVYFTTKTCIVCRTRQEPALDTLRGHLPGVSIERHDAVEARALASEYGVLSVPTTAVYDRTGTLVAINRGFAPAAVLLGQLEGRDVPLEGGADMQGELVDA